MNEFKQNFNNWFFSKNDIIPKTIGALVLLSQIIDFSTRIVVDKPVDDKIYTLIVACLNFGASVFIYYLLRKLSFSRFELNVRESSTTHATVKSHGINFSANDFEKANDNIKHIHYLCMFFASFVMLYALLTLREMLLLHNYLNKVIDFFLYGSKDLQSAKLRVHDILIVISFLYNIIQDALNLLASVYLVKFVIVLENPLVTGKDAFKTKCKSVDLVYVILISANFLSKFITPAGSANMKFGIAFCIINAISFLFMFARLDNKIFAIPKVFIVSLYIYAVIQVLFPFITVGQTQSCDIDNFYHQISRIAILYGLYGKIIMSAIIIYLVNSGRLFYFFLTSKIANDITNQEVAIFNKSVSILEK